MKECNDDHEHDSYAPGPVYQVKIFMDDGTILSSNPMTGEKGSALQETLRMIGSGTSLRYIGPTKSRELLVEASQEWRKSGVDIERYLAPDHAGFSEASDRAIEHSDRLDEEAKSLSD